MENLFSKNFRKKKIILILTSIIIGVGLFSILAQSVFAATAVDSGLTVGSVAIQGLGLAVASVVGFLAMLITSVVGLLITLVIKVLINVAQFNNIIGVEAVVNGWVIVRDLCNMFFILILLVVAFATILRIESYQWKKILPKLLIMAVLINFSRTICGLIIDFAQVIMLTFANGFSEGGGYFIQMFNTQFISKLDITMSTDKVFSNWDAAVASIAGVIAAAITLIVLVVMLAVLVMRIVMLWIYVILSPFAFLAAAFPAGQKYASQWWGEFSKNVIVGPVLAFFIWLALTTVNSSAGTLMQGKTTSLCAGFSAFFCDVDFVKFILAIGFLAGGLMITQQMGGIAASIAGKGMDWAKKIGFAPGLAVGGIAKFGAFKAGRLADSAQMGIQGFLAKGVSKATKGYFGEKYQAKSLNYRMVKEGWNKNQDVKMRQYEGTKSGAWQDQFNRTLSASVGLPIISQIKRKNAEIQIKKNEEEMGKIQGAISEDKQKLKAEGTPKAEKMEINEKIKLNEGKIAAFKKTNRGLADNTATWGRLPIQKFARLEEQQKANEEYGNIKKEDLNEEGLVHNYMSEGRVDKKRAYLMHLADINGINTLFDARGEDMNFENIKSLFEEFGNAAGDVAAEVSRRAEAAGNYKMMGFHKFDVTQSKNRLVDTDTEQFNYAMRKDNERYSQNHGRTTHFDSLVDRHPDGTNSLSDIGAEQLLHIAGNQGRMDEIRKGNYQVRYGEMVVNLKPQIINKVEELRGKGEIAKADNLKKVFEEFEKNYGISGPKQEKKSGKKTTAGTQKNGEAQSDDD